MNAFLRFIILSLLFVFVSCGLSAREPSLREKIGQMFMVGFRGTDLNDDSRIIKDIKELNLGGVILFNIDLLKTVSDSGELNLQRLPKRNIESLAQLQSLTSTLQGVSKEPLFIAVDQEGGCVARLGVDSGFCSTLSHAKLGELDDAEVTYGEAFAISSGLKSAGINLNLAPVVDLNINRDNPVIGVKSRSFSVDTSVVVNHAREYVAAHRGNAILTALKHFPGHGSSAKDSHKGFVDVSDSWSVEELEPFSLLINGGYADMVMTAHVFNDRLDPDFPATLSWLTLTGLLRNQLGYQGIIITDDIQMLAIADHYGREDALRYAINAGVDVIILANMIGYDEDAAKESIESIVRMVEVGEISENRIHESYTRIMSVKQAM